MINELDFFLYDPLICFGTVNPLFVSVPKPMIKTCRTIKRALVDVIAVSSLRSPINR